MRSFAATGNACGQAALAALLHHWGLAPAAGLVEHVRALAPPDTPRAFLGTTPWGLARAARRLGLRAAWTWSWRAGDLRAGDVALVDVRALGRSLRPRAAWPLIAVLGRPAAATSLPRGHWVVVEHVDADEVALANAHARAVPRAAFERAWACVPVPGYRHAVVRIEPPSDDVARGSVRKALSLSRVDAAA